MLIAAEYQLPTQLLDVDRVALPEEKSWPAMYRVDASRCSAVVAGTTSTSIDRLDLAQSEQRLEALGDEILVRRQRVVRQRLPVGQRPHRKRRVEVRNLVDEALCVERVGGNDDEQAPLAARGGGGLRQQQRIGRARRPREGKTGPCDR